MQKSPVIFIVTDLEGVGGVLNFPDWCVPEGRRNECGCRFLTEEVNAVAAGFFDGGAGEVIVCDAHGSGGSIRGEMLDDRCYLRRGSSGSWYYPENTDALAFVGQHAKAGTPFGHLAHTQTQAAVDFRLNGVSIGEYGQLAAVAAEQHIPTIFGAGDLAFCREAEALTPGVVTVAVKQGICPVPPSESTLSDDVFSAESGALHYPRSQTLPLLRIRAAEAVRKLIENPGSFQFPQIPGAPYVVTARYRAASTEIEAMFGRKLPARRFELKLQPSVAEALEHFYRDLEWNAADHQESWEL